MQALWVHGIGISTVQHQKDCEEMFLNERVLMFKISCRIRQFFLIQQKGHLVEESRLIFGQQSDQFVE
ncbi:hypothetical protein AF332_27685 [Sporosarcina globispora]|uniref:Uncharacterized protein n=1 Tax=Sporosarcina globispora TaxID=1459 RepID=A0A0M0G1S5_SPOGL|nr:hypothetical protein [Sporosarcina globispora]KON83532.1 hypothetical protein AF332_27685 [Sporosarcina globispora]